MLGSRPRAAIKLENHVFVGGIPFQVGLLLFFGIIHVVVWCFFGAGRKWGVTREISRPTYTQHQTRFFFFSFIVEVLA